MLKRSKPGLVSSNSSARLLEDVVADKDHNEQLIQSSRVSLLSSFQWRLCLWASLKHTFVSQYYYSVRVLPGQEPFNVWVGWVTSNFHHHEAAFDPDRVHTVTVTLGDDSGKVQERSVRDEL